MKQDKRDKILKIKKRFKKITRTLILFTVALGFAIIFLLPTVLTITNSFMKIYNFFFTLNKSHFDLFLRQAQ